jgi:valyl-tRNA synthetase
MKADWSDFQDDLPFDQAVKQMELVALSPAAIRFFKNDTNTLPKERVAHMNEITVAVNALRAAADALSALSKKLDLQAFDEKPAAAASGVTVQQLQMLAANVATEHGTQKVKEIIAAEAGGKKIADMSASERDLVRIAFDLLAAQVAR